jgi:hypothetical protein
MVLNIKENPPTVLNFYRSGSSRESGQADFLIWKEYGREMEVVRIKRK